MIRMILAIDAAGTLGWSDGRLAYRLPNDMKRFKELTTNGIVVMGHSTFRSLKRKEGLPNRRNIVLSRQPYSVIREEIGSTVEVISSFDWLERASTGNLHVADLKPKPNSEFWLIGGASVYDEALTRGIVDEIHLTLVHASSDADVRLKTDLAAWKLFMLREREQQRFWSASVGETELDGDFYTTYILLRRQH